MLLITFFQIIVIVANEDEVESSGRKEIVERKGTAPKKEKTPKVGKGKVGRERDGPRRSKLVYICRDKRQASKRAGTRLSLLLHLGRDTVVATICALLGL